MPILWGSHLDLFFGIYRGCDTNSSAYSRVGGDVFGVNGMRIFRGDEEPRVVGSLMSPAIRWRKRSPSTRTVPQRPARLPCEPENRVLRQTYSGGPPRLREAAPSLADRSRDRQGVGLRYPGLAPTSTCCHPLCRLVGRLSRQQRRQAVQRRQPDAAQGRMRTRRRTNR